MSGYERIYISPDLTKEQQLQDKKLRDKLKEIGVEHRKTKINNNDIVILENGSKKILYSLNWLLENQSEISNKFYSDAIVKNK